MIDLIDLKWLAIPNSFHCFYGILSKNRDLAYFVTKRLHTKSWSFEINLKIRIMYRLRKWNMITDKLTSFWDQLQVTIVMSIALNSPKLIQFISCLRAQFYILMYKMNIIYAICPEDIHSLISSHTPRTHQPHTPRDLHTQFINTFTDAPPHTHTQNHHHSTTCPLHKMATLKMFFFFFFVFVFFSSSSKTHSVHAFRQ